VTQTGPSAISAPIELQLVAPDGAFVPVEADFGYDPDDPFAIRAEFTLTEGEAPVVWIFARDLITAGLEAPAGQGDVALWPSQSRGEPVVCLALSSPGGQALLECRREDLEGFLEQTLCTVAAGDESRHLDVDTPIDRLLEGS
jgi:Streptomyces sporulation and cell division protein, SsgA